MSTITTLNDGITGASFRGTTNTNFSNLNTDKAELSGGTFTGDISVPAEVYGVGWNGSNEVPTKNDLYDKIETLGSGSVATDAIWDAKGDLAGGTGANTASRLAVGTNGQVLTADSAEATGLKWSNPAGGGDALTSGTLAQFASTTSLELKGVISDETGSGSLVFATSPTLVTPVLGTPTSGTLTNCAGLPVAGITASTSTALGVGSIELGHATDTTITRVSAGVISVEGVTVPTISSTSTLTNKRHQPRIVSATSYTTDTGTSLDFSTCDIFIVTAQAGALKFNNPSGTPQHGEKIIIRCKDNGTARALTYDTQYRAVGVTLPTTTVISKTLYLGGIWNTTDTKLDIIAVSQE